MKDINSYLTNLQAPSAGFSKGKLKDNPGDNSGTGIVSDTHNDFLYAFYALALKYSVISDTAESENASDILNALERMTGHNHVSGSEYSAVTTYAAGDQVFRRGVQFISLAASNTGNDPVSSPTWWMPVHDTKNVLAWFREGKIIRAGAHLSDKSGDAAYLQNMKYGLHNIGGTSGQNYQAYKVHLDGTVVTGNPTLVAIFDPGGANEYAFINTFAPDSGGTRTLVNYSATATGEAAEGVPFILVLLPV